VTRKPQQSSTLVAAARKCRLDNLSDDAVNSSDAVGLLETNAEHPFHRFWRDQIGFVEAVKPFAARIRGHQQVTDTYLPWPWTGECLWLVPR
jgi:hypothetical protein